MQSVRVVEAVTKHTGTVIFLHGLGDAGTSFIPMAQLLQRQHPNLKFILPSAKPRPITINSGYPMPAWFDYGSALEDSKGMLASVAAVEYLIEKEVAESHIKSERIFVGGFSQGGVISILTGLNTPRKLGGVICLSGWLPMRAEIPQLVSPTVKDLAVFWGHGIDDGVVSYKVGEASVALLHSHPSIKLPVVPKGVAFQRPGVRFESYLGLEHSLGDKELRDISAWLTQAIPA